MTATANGAGQSTPASAQDLLHVIIANLPVALYIAQDGKFALVSPAFERISGYSQAELLGMDSLQIVHPEDRAMVRENARKMLKGDLHEAYGFRIVTRSGKPRWVMENVASVQYQGRRATLGNYMDITEHKQAEDAIGREKDFTAGLLKGLNVGVCVADETGRQVMVNDELCRMTGFTQEELLGQKPPFSYWAEEAQAETFKAFEATFRGAEGEYELVFRKKSGERFTALVTPRQTTDPEGRTIFFATIRDITARRRMEEQLRQAAQEWRTTFDSITDFVSVQDRDCRIVRANRALADALHMRPAELVGRNCWEVIHGRSGPICDCPHLETIRTGRVASLETFEPRFGMHINVTTSPIFDEKGQVLGTVHIVKDITERKKAEEAVRRAHEFQATVLNATNDAVSLIDTSDYRILGVNHAFLKQHEVKETEVIGKKCYEVIHHWSEPCDRMGEVCPLLDAVVKGEPAITRHVHHNSHSEPVYVEVAAFPVKDEQGKVVQVVHVSRDVTERHRADEIFRTVADSSPIGILIIQEGIIKYINPLAARVLGWTQAEVIGMTAASLIHPEDREMERQNAIRALKGESVPPYDFRVITRNGDVKWVVEKLAPIRHEGERATLTSLMDVTELKLADKVLRDYAEKLRLIFDCVPDGIAVTDMAMNITEVNDATVRMYGGTDKGELIGRNAFNLIAEKDHAVAENGVRTTLERGYSGRIALSILRKDSSQLPVELSASVLRDGSFKPIGFVGVIEDVSERKAIEEQLMIADRLASIGELASGVAHELNNPLTSVIGFSQLIMEKEAPDNIRQEIEIIAREAQRAAQVVKNLLTFARKHAPSRQPTNINTIIEKVLEIRAYEQKVSNITVVTHLSLDLPALMVDDFQVQQVFFNIVINAEYFMIEAHGRGTLTITTERDRRFVRAYFADDGPGIAPGNLEHIFDPFFTTKGIGKGTGLGLSICHGIVTSHGGRIYAESEPGKGATFIVELPIGEE
ncbi:MAG: PAS domain S-box protein [Chloroflexi bacterium]|nr:PAS domain S-box protein [Chloroflexota bacterium]